MKVSLAVWRAIKDLRPGTGIGLVRCIFARKRDGTWIGVHDSCDEVHPRIFRSADHACRQAEEWKARFKIEERPPQPVEIPSSVDEIAWVVGEMTHETTKNVRADGEVRRSPSSGHEVVVQFSEESYADFRAAGDRLGIESNGVAVHNALRLLEWYSHAHQRGAKLRMDLSDGTHEYFELEL